MTPLTQEALWKAFEETKEQISYDVLSYDSYLSDLLGYVTDIISTVQKQLLEQVDKEVVGEDETWNWNQTNKNRITRISNNELRTEQRTKLREIEGEL